MITAASRKVLGKKRRCRKHVQLALALKRDKNGQGRGGARKGAGRKPLVPGRPKVRHAARPEINRRHPQHVTLRVLGDVGYLRKPHFYRAIRLALVAIIERQDFRIVHFSLQGNHLHLICEADDKRALSRGMRAFMISASQRLNREMSAKRGTPRRGTVFADRYHARPVTSVRQVRNCLSYVLNNWRKHGCDRDRSLFDGKLDPYSSAIWFLGWKERTREPYVPPDYEPPTVSTPRTWLLAEGYKRAPTISVYEVPSRPAGL